MMEESLFGLSVPIDTYGMTKYLIARELISSNRESINLRLFGVYGKYEDYYRRFISNNICRSLVGLPLSMNKNMYFDYIHVDDLSRLIVLLIDKINLKSNEYNFCTGKPISLKEIAMLICEEMQLETSVLIKEKGLNAEYSGSPKKILSEIGLFQFNDIKAEIKILVEYYKNILVDENLEKFKAKIHE
jgi:GDP-L-fucose synthase